MPNTRRPLIILDTLDTARGDGELAMTPPKREDAVGSESDPPASGHDDERGEGAVPPATSWTTRDTVSTVFAGLILAAGLFVALSPTLVYATTPRIILFFLIALLPSVLFASSVTARFTAKVGVIAFSAGGPAAVFFGGLFALDMYAKPEERIAVYHLYSSETRKVIANSISLDAIGAAQGNPNWYLSDSRTEIVVRYPDSEPTVHLVVESPLGTHFCRLSYAGTRTSMVYLIEGEKECKFHLD